MKCFSKIALIAALTLMGTFSFAAPNASNTADKANVEKIVHDYLVNKPEVLMEAMQVLQKKQYEQTQQAVKQTQQTAGAFANDLFHQANDPVIGNPNGKVTIVEFFDYQCAHCIDMAPVMAAIVKANPDVRVVYKEFPIRGAMSELAARYALAANMQGKYAAFSHDVLSANKPLNEALLLEIAKKSGVNVDQLQKDADNASVKDKLKATLKLAQNLKLFGTPAIFIGKSDASGKDSITYVPGQMDQAQLQNMIAELSK